MKAWLLIWEGPAIIPDRKIAAILSYRRSTKFVADLVDVLYSQSVDSAYDMAFLANKRKLREHEYLIVGSTAGRLFYGRNLCIFARQVANLMVKRDDTQKTELICWTELAIYKNDESGSGIVQAAPPQNCQHFRSIGPLSREVHESSSGVKQ